MVTDDASTLHPMPTCSGGRWCQGPELGRPVIGEAVGEGMPGASQKPAGCSRQVKSLGKEQASSQHSLDGLDGCRERWEADEGV